MVKKSYFLALILCMTSSGYPRSHNYYQEADEWAFENFFSPQNRIPATERDLTLNFIYCAYMRSHATLEAQKSACATLETVWQSWQNIAQTRMNPSVQAPYTIHYENQSALFEQFLRMQQLHRICGQRYAIAAEETIKGAHSAAHEQAIKHLRERSREVIMKEFLDIKKVLGELYDYACNYKNIFADDEYDQIDRFDLLDTIVSYIPSYYAAHSFIEAERLQATASKQCWQTLKTITDVSIQIWNAVETARMAYYGAHYTAMVHYMKQYNICLPQLMFDERGVIPVKKRNQRLPSHLSHETPYTVVLE